MATPTSFASLISEDIAALKELGGFLASLPLALVVVIIFIKNASALLPSFALNPIFCLLPILTLTVNGWLLTFVSALVSQEKSLKTLPWSRQKDILGLLNTSLKGEVFILASLKSLAASQFYLMPRLY